MRLVVIFSIGWAVQDRVCTSLTLCRTRIPYANGPTPFLGPRWSPPSSTVLPHASSNAPHVAEPPFRSGCCWLWSCSNMKWALPMKISATACVPTSLNLSEFVDG